ncbi:helix-turn-helix domain-containing protein [uncultured Microbulbifer sp.]|uniref:helix-turn-helix domain-containing protein n=1 Tax=uncultured Microbulbifer sp. TaxID=348147 RepID=UPI00261AC086|nr:helix-turn-helix transcriptional regulator [uncultured Microbulbifer sp.]
MTDLKMQFGHRLAEIRKKKGVTQEALAAGAGCSVRTIADIEAGKHGPRFDLLQRIAGHLQCPVKTLFDFPDT